jgi:hypothetical protein
VILQLSLKHIFRFTQPIFSRSLLEVYQLVCILQFKKFEYVYFMNGWPKAPEYVPFVEVQPLDPSSDMQYNSTALFSLKETEYYSNFLIAKI